MGVNFALGDVTTLRLEKELDRILERNDMFATFEIHLLHQGRESGGFSTADRAGYEDQSILITRQ